MSSTSVSETEKVTRDIVFDFMDALQSPLITFETSWADTIPPRLKDIIPIARLKGLMKGEELATYAEVAAYLYTRSCVAPMDYQWANIHCYVGTMVCHHYFGETHFKALNVTGLTDEEKDMLYKLRKQIYNKRREILKKQMKDGSKHRNEHTVSPSVT